MKTLNLLLATAISVSPALTSAEGLLPTMERKYEFCQERPPEPEWIQNMHVREGGKRLLVQSIYRLEGYERVSEAGNCECETLYPSWDNAVQRFNDNYLHLEGFDLMQTRREFQDQGTALRNSVKALCEGAGHW